MKRELGAAWVAAVLGVAPFSNAAGPEGRASGTACCNDGVRISCVGAGGEQVAVGCKHEEAARCLLMSAGSGSLDANPAIDVLEVVAYCVPIGGPTVTSFEMRSSGNIANDAQTLAERFGVDRAAVRPVFAVATVAHWFEFFGDALGLDASTIVGVRTADEGVVGWLGAWSTDVGGRVVHHVDAFAGPGKAVCVLAGKCADEEARQLCIARRRADWIGLENGRWIARVDLSFIEERGVTPQDHELLSGRVTGRWGEPLAGAIVALSRAGERSVATAAQVGIDGRYAIRLAPGRYTIRVSMPFYKEEVLRDVLVPSAGHVERDVVLRPVDRHILLRSEGMTP